MLDYDEHFRLDRLLSEAAGSERLQWRTVNHVLTALEVLDALNRSELFDDALEDAAADALAERSA